MSEVGAVFSEGEVVALLDGRKRCTRILIRPQPEAEHLSHLSGRMFETDRSETIFAPCSVGDTLWVKERFANMEYDCNEPTWTYKAGTPSTDTPGWMLPLGVHWCAPQSMPRAAARLFLRVVSVRAERLRKIGELSARLEGFERSSGRVGLTYAGSGTWISRGHPSYERGIPPSALAEFACFWDGRHRKAGERFADDPWVFVIGFEREER